MKLLKWIYTKRYNTFDLMTMCALSQAIRYEYIGMIGAVIWVVVAAALSVAVERQLTNPSENHNEH